MNTDRAVRALGLALLMTALGGMARGGAARAQTFALDADKPTALWMEVQRPAFRADQHLSAWLGVVGVRHEFADQLSLLAGLPFARADRASYRVDTLVIPGTSATQVGNPYVGLRFGRPWRTLAVDAVISVRLGERAYQYEGWRYPCLSNPNYCYYYDYGTIAPENVVGLAAASGDYDRYELFERAFPWSVRAVALASRHLSRSLSVHLRAGGMFVGGGGVWDQLYGDLAAASTYESRRTVVSAGVSMRTATGAWDGRVTWQLTAGLGYRIGGATPTVFVRLPLQGPERYQPLARYVLGAAVTVEFPEGRASQ